MSLHSVSQQNGKDDDTGRSGSSVIGCADRDSVKSAPVLIIVMGTSGSGKSTLGARLALRLGQETGSGQGLTFIDGDDLHPPSNVAKMARGEPLTDTDREPWLHSVRETALSMLSKGAKSTKSSREGEHEDGSKAVPTTLPRDEQRALAEVYETSATAKAGNPTSYNQTSGPAAPPADTAMPSQARRAARTTSQPAPACVIACSALKRVYRNLLRGDTDSLEVPSSSSRPSSALRVVHVYASTPPLLLLARMRARKGHFMGAGMLRSQLDTLEEPHPASERDIIIVDAVQGQLPPAALEPLPTDDQSPPELEQLEQQLLGAQRDVDDLADEAARAVLELVGPLR